jgi:hypothetical protein
LITDEADKRIRKLVRYQNFLPLRACKFDEEPLDTERESQLEILSVKVKPNSKQQKIEQQEGGSWIAHLKSPPIGGKANEELIRLLSEQFNLPQSCITIKSGASSKTKLIQLDR